LVEKLIFFAISDHVFGENVKNVDIFKTLVEPMVKNAVKGFNATILAYGQTSSGNLNKIITAKI
jgi:Kinesin motor domain